VGWKGQWKGEEVGEQILGLTFCAYKGRKIHIGISHRTESE
jgi:hypothetical protein